MALGVRACGWREPGSLVRNTRKPVATTGQVHPVARAVGRRPGAQPAYEARACASNEWEGRGEEPALPGPHPTRRSQLACMTPALRPGPFKLGFRSTPVSAAERIRHRVSAWQADEDLAYVDAFHLKPWMGLEVEPARVVAGTECAEASSRKATRYGIRRPEVSPDRVKATREAGTADSPPTHARATPPFGRFAMWRSRILRVVMRCSPRCGSSRASGVTRS
jgi:hypothetical protein